MAESLEREIEGLRALFRSERDPDGRAFVPLADAYRRNRDLDRALQLLAEGLERHPDFASAHVVSAWIHRDRGDPDNARLAWARVLELDDENVEALKGLGTLLLESGRLDEALPYLERACSLDPDTAEATPPAAPEPAREAAATAVADTLYDVDGSFDAQDEALLAAVEAAARAPGRTEASFPAAVPDTDVPNADRPDSEMPDAEMAELEVSDLDLSDVGLPVAGAPRAEGPDLIALAELLVPPSESDHDEEPDSVALADLLAQPPAPEPHEIASVLPDDAWRGELERVERSAEPEPGAHEEKAGVAEEPWPADEANEEPRTDAADQEPILTEAVGTSAGADVLRKAEEIMEVWSAREEEEEEHVDTPAALPATRTMAELFVRQGLYARAVGIYEQLVAASPDDDALAERLEELRGELRPAQPANPVSVHADDTEAIAQGWWSVEEELTASPFGWTPDEPSSEEMDKGGEPISSYFRRLLAWEPARADEEVAAVGSADGEIAAVGAADADAGAGAPEMATAALAVAEPGAATEEPPTWTPAPVPEQSAEHGVGFQTDVAASAVTEEPPAQERPWTESPHKEPSWLAPHATPTEVDEVDQRVVVPIASLAPDEPALAGAPAGASVVPVASLAPDAVPIESLAPDAEPSQDGSAIRF